MLIRNSPQIFLFTYAYVPRCHLGKVLRYDTVSKLKWSVDIRSHPISVIIEKLLADDWPGDDATGKGVPELIDEEECVVCPSIHASVFLGG